MGILVPVARTIGYPIIILLSGTYGFDGEFNTFIGLVLIQSLMSILIPLILFLF